MTPKVTKTSTEDALEYSESIIKTVLEPLIALDQAFSLKILVPIFQDFLSI